MPLSGIDLSNIDPSVRPQDDLYQHVNGAWLKSTEIPDDRPLEGTFTALRDGVGTRREGDHRGRGGPGRGRHRDRAEDRGPLQQLHGRSRGGGQGHGPDPGAARRGLRHGARPPNSWRWPAGCSARTWAASSTSIPPPTPETRTGSCCTPARAAWACRMSRTTAKRSSPRWSRPTGTMCGPCSASPGSPDPEAAAGRVVALETALASHHWDNVTLRDPQKTYNLKSADEAAELFPLLATWFDAAGIDAGKARGTRREHPGLLRRGGVPAGLGAAVRLAGMAGHAGHQRRRAVPVRRVRGCQLRLLRHHAQRHAAQQGPLEARRRRRRGRASARPSARSTWPGTSRKPTRPACRRWWRT